MSSYIYDMTDTWNNGATVFSAIKMNVTNTASAAGSKTVDLQIGGVAQPGTVFANGTILTTFDGTVYAGFVPGTNGDTLYSGVNSSGVVISNLFRISGYSAGGSGAPTLLGSAGSQFGWASAGGASNSGDTFLTRKAAAVVEVGPQSGSGGGAILTTPCTVANLPSAATAGVGARAFVTDASTTVILGLGTTVTGGGANKVPVYSDGANWIYG